MSSVFCKKKKTSFFYKNITLLQRDLQGSKDRVDELNGTITLKDKEIKELQGNKHF